MGELIGIPIEMLAPSALLGVAILMIFVGKLWTNPAYQQKVEECKKWEKAYERSEAARALSDAQTTQLLEQAKTTHAMVVAMNSVLATNSSGGTSHVVPLA